VKGRADWTPDTPERRSKIDQCGPLDQIGPVNALPREVSFDAVRAVHHRLVGDGRKPLDDPADLLDAAELLRALGLVADPRSYDNLPDCPTCSAAAGTSCRDFSRKSLEEPHPQRLKAFAEMFETPTRKEADDNA
jgi:hypothetical protein